MNDGGPAFPSHGSMGEVAHEGMSLRDYFAIHAPEPSAEAVRVLEGYRKERAPYEPRLRDEVDIRSALRYQFADAMLAERAKPSPWWRATASSHDSADQITGE